MKDKLLEKLKSAVANPLRLSLKLFGLIWLFLFIHVILKLTFNYWQPYIIPTEQLENVGNFIDDHIFINKFISGILYIINGLLLILCGIQRWWFKNKKETFIVGFTLLLMYLLNELFNLDNITIIISSFVIPLVLDKKKWLWIILSFVCSFIFLALSLWIEGYSNANNMNYVVALFLNNDYYIMLIMNYILFNIIRLKKEGN